MVDLIALVLYLLKWLVVLVDLAKLLLLSVMKFLIESNGFLLASNLVDLNSR
jgi:hypothetical protein